MIKGCIIIVMLLCSGRMTAQTQLILPKLPSQPNNMITLRGKRLPDPSVVDMHSLKKLNEDNLVARLKQDGMPCIIPSAGYRPMPNGFRARQYKFNIPNFWQPDTTGIANHKSLQIKR